MRSAEVLEQGDHALRQQARPYRHRSRACTALHNAVLLVLGGHYMSHVTCVGGWLARAACLMLHACTTRSKSWSVCLVRCCGGQHITCSHYRHALT